MFIKKSPWRFVGYSSEQLSGAYTSKFHSNGLEFSQVQPYVAGENITSIDWKTSAKKSQLYVKHFTPERALDVYFCVDVSSSCCVDFFWEKKDLQYELIELLSHAVYENHDVANVILYDEKIVFMREKLMWNHVSAQINHYMKQTFIPSWERKNMASCLEYMIQKKLKNKVIFFFTDQYEHFDQKLFALAQHNSVVILGCFHHTEIEWFPEKGYAKFHTNQGNMYLGSSWGEQNQIYQKLVEETLIETQKTLMSHKVHFSYFSTHDQVGQKLLKFLQQKF